MIKVKTYKIFSTLLSYPSNEFKECISSIIPILKEENLLSEDCIDKLAVFIDYINCSNLLDLQENYVSIFDRQKRFSLYLFEHIHGDARERGMAMVDLKNLYKASDFDIDSNIELPDYIPVFLEYLSLMPKEKSSILLGEIINIIAVIGRRLQLFNSLYYIIFDLLEYLSNFKSDKKIIDGVILDRLNDKIDCSKVDEEWEEPKVF
ncbi:MAG TPA: nitrate reductase molybdenum cofactor assembly chaperone [Candidatus Azoamicus sp. OHIO1]